MKNTHRLVIAIAALAAVSSGVFSLRSHAGSAAPARTPDIGRGEYLVTHLGACADCHSQRNEKGEFIQELWLLGGPLTFAPTVPMPVWAEAALPIAGLPSFPTDEEAVQFFMTGKRANGVMPRPPMPAYQLRQEDAEDIVGYLRSLKKG